MIFHTGLIPNKVIHLKLVLDHFRLQKPQWGLEIATPFFLNFTKVKHRWTFLLRAFFRACRRLHVFLNKAVKHRQTHMLLAGWEVRIVKNCDRGLENAARGRKSLEI